MLTNKNNEKVLVEGLTARQWVELLQTNKAKNAMKAINYYDGNQLEELIKVMNETRKDWKTRGFIPRVRNLVTAIVDKSGMLFKDQLPTLEVWKDNAVAADESATQLVSDELHKIGYGEFFSNVDAVVRLLKTAIVLVQYDKDEKQFVLDVLHRGNCEVMINPSSKAIEALIYRFSEDASSTDYRIITKEKIFDLRETDTNIHLLGEEDNVFGIVPAVAFYDTKAPRSGFWVEAPHDLVGLNEIVNLHLTDSEFAATWAKRPTLFTNAQFKGNNSGHTEVMEVYGEPLPQLVQQSNAVTGGPGQAVILNTMGVENPFIKYESPNPALKETEEVVEGWIKSFAHDWSVAIDVAGAGRASSGFQLIVEELPNLDLRKQRGKMFAMGMGRLYKVMAKIGEVLRLQNRFPTNAGLFVTFPDPSLPLDAKEQEEAWALRFANRTATPIDYYMQVLGLSEEEAKKRDAEVKQYYSGNNSTLQQTEEIL